MYGVYLLFILAVQTDGFTSNNVQCNYIFSQQCYEDVNNYNIIDYDSLVINYCSIEDVPAEVNFTLIPNEDEGEELTDFLRVDFIPPNVQCKYEIALLVEPSIKDERECAKYNFEGVKDITTKIHTVEKSLCVLTHNYNQFARYNNNLTVSFCKDNIVLWYRYIFTGCYALQFHVGTQRYIIRGHKFLNTTYRHMKIVEPLFTCKYEIHSKLNKSHDLTNFALKTFLSTNAGSLFHMSLISDRNKTVQQPCLWLGEKSLHTSIVNLDNEASDNHNCSINMMQTVNKEYTKTIQCNFQVPTKHDNAGYCFMFTVIDERCQKSTIWKPHVHRKLTCTWLKRCMRTYENSLYIENNVTKSDKPLSASSYLLLPIIAIVLVVSVIVGTLYLMYYQRIRNEEVNLYVNPQDDFTNLTCFKPAEFGIVDNDTEKGIERDNLVYDDIVVLYTKASPSFMALMKDFREMLLKISSCTVHDWHDGAELNDVARIGAVLWFTRLLNNGCRVVWIDTPATRSLVISNLKGSDSRLSKLSKYHEIGDFRELAFPVVLELAKRNMKDLRFQYRKHFVVRFEGLESSENVNDPFLDLSPHARYLIPQHLAQLCSDLSIAKPAISRYEMKEEEDFLQQRLKFMKMESIM